jgi:hypothetical protein
MAVASVIAPPAPVRTYSAVENLDHFHASGGPLFCSESGLPPRTTELGFGTAGTSPAGAIGSAVLAEPGASAGSTCVGDVGALGARAAARDARHDEPMMSARASGPRPNDVRLACRCRSICLRSVGGLIGHHGAARSRFSWRLACGVPCIARRPLRAENGPDQRGRRVKCCLELLDLTVTSGSVLTTLVLSRVSCVETRGASTRRRAARCRGRLGTLARRRSNILHR